MKKLYLCEIDLYKNNNNNMKKIIPFLLCMLVALCACEKDTPNPPASVDSMRFEGVSTTLDEGESINLSGIKFKIKNKFNLTPNLIQIYLIYHFSDIYASIKNKVLDILLLLEQKCGNLDSYDLNLTDTKKQEVIPLILNIIFHDNSITIGNKNKIVDSHLMTQRTM